MMNLWYSQGHLGQGHPSQGQGHFNVKVIPELNCKCLDFYHEVGGWLSTECILVPKGFVFTFYGVWPRNNRCNRRFS